MMKHTACLNVVASFALCYGIAIGGQPVQGAPPSYDEGLIRRLSVELSSDTRRSVLSKVVDVDGKEVLSQNEKIELLLRAVHAWIAAELRENAEGAQLGGLRVTYLTLNLFNIQTELLLAAVAHELDNPDADMREAAEIMLATRRAEWTSPETGDAAEFLRDSAVRDPQQEGFPATFIRALFDEDPEWALGVVMHAQSLKIDERDRQTIDDSLADIRATRWLIDRWGDKVEGRRLETARDALRSLSKERYWPVRLYVAHHALKYSMLKDGAGLDHLVDDPIPVVQLVADSARK